MPYFAIDVGDDLIEEYSGVGVRFESRKLGTERLGVYFEWSTFDQTWRDQTLVALPAYPNVPALYRNRTTVTPLVKFAITPQLSVAGGVSITELDPFDELSSNSQMANAAIGSVRFNQRWKPASGVQPRSRSRVHACEPERTRSRATSCTSATSGRRTTCSRSRKHRVFVSSMFGGITGDAPLFERFSLGDSRTLRGWDKYDIAPAGGDRMFHASAEYRYRGCSPCSSIPDRCGTRVPRQRVRFSTGFGFTPGPVFFMVGFPLNTDEFRAVFTMGIRFSTSGLGLTGRTDRGRVRVSPRPRRS